MKRFLTLFFTFSVCFLSVVQAAQTLSGLAVVIDRFELKDAAGQWYVLIEPDKKVDLSEKEFYLSFFNDGRIPAGFYSNFRLVVSDKDKSGLARIRKMTAIGDLSKPMKIGKSSFVSLQVNVQAGTVEQPIKTVERIVLDVDDQNVILNKTDINLENSWL